MAMSPHTVPPARDNPTPTGSAVRVGDVAAVATTSIFAGGALLSQIVIVPGWPALDPTAFLHHFATYGPATGATVFPFELASALLLGHATYTAFRSRRSNRLVWLLAAACMAGTLALLIYFVPANFALLNPAYPAQAVPAALAAWYRWNWGRAGLGLAAAVLACAALSTEPPKQTPP